MSLGRGSSGLTMEQAVRMQLGLPLIFKTESEKEMGYFRARKLLKSKKHKKYKNKERKEKMNHFAMSNDTKDLQQTVIESAKDSREEEWMILRYKLKSFFFPFQADELLLGNGDMVTDTVQCTAYYEMEGDTPIVNIVDIEVDGDKSTLEFGEMIGLAYEKIVKALDIKQKK